MHIDITLLPANYPLSVRETAYLRVVPGCINIYIYNSRSMILLRALVIVSSSNCTSYELVVCIIIIIREYYENDV